MTSFFSSGGYYVYIETSGSRRNGDKARLVSPNVNSGQYCLTFWYFMYGQHVDHLNVYIMAGNTIPSTPLWTRARDQGRAWRQANVDVPRVASTFNVCTIADIFLFLWDCVSGKNKEIVGRDNVCIRRKVAVFAKSQPDVEFLVPVKEEK